MTRRATLTPAKLTAFIKAAKDAGMSIGSCEVRPDGSILIRAESDAGPTATPLDDWLGKNGYRNEGAA
jgi:hypothetical protein